MNHIDEIALRCVGPGVSNVVTKRTRMSDHTAQSAVVLSATVGLYLSVSTGVMLSVFRRHFKHRKLVCEGIIVS